MSPLKLDFKLYENEVDFSLLRASYEVSNRMLMGQEAALNRRGCVPHISTGLLLMVNDRAFGPFCFDDKNDCSSFTIATSTISFVLYTTVTFIWSIIDSLLTNKHPYDMVSEEQKILNATVTDLQGGLLKHCKMIT